MPLADVNGVKLYYKTHGQGEALVLIPGLGAGHTAWFRQLPAFKKQLQGHHLRPQKHRQERQAEAALWLQGLGR